MGMRMRWHTVHVHGTVTYEFEAVCEDLSDEEVAKISELQGDHNELVAYLEEIDVFNFVELESAAEYELDDVKVGEV